MVCSRKCNIFLRDGNSECASTRIGYQERNTEIFQGRTSGEDFIERTPALFFMNWISGTYNNKGEPLMYTPIFEDLITAEWT